ncbi:hypothetical protein [Paraglaciecola arctica]|uniref:Uncharacterized protein n=1 Tax=Paraglaciecola arctica BSs20135 TaxID=493475 RepID=K6YTL1_9ALTE|nr:hypothetical protein [Paraglaciecola arctica]GAC20048.1 hypothetical protein GARC_3085 [Paraglaciecola arctica BSs20135]|tara:strand:+ start:1774 stop:1971 length:198 start_codon:yes stop_codon:yes gene_type:complete
MSNWHEPILFGFTLITFVLGISSIIMSFLPAPEGTNVMQSKIEYGFFGASGLALFAVFVYALATV